MSSRCIGVIAGRLVIGILVNWYLWWGVHDTEIMIPLRGVNLRGWLVWTNLFLVKNGFPKHVPKVKARLHQDFFVSMSATRFNDYQISELCGVWLCWKSMKLVLYFHTSPVSTWSVMSNLRYMMFVKPCSPTRWRKKLDADGPLSADRSRPLISYQTEFLVPKDA